LKAWTSPCSVESSSGLPALALDGLPRLGQLDLLGALGGDHERDALA
jgi:hypothetical protein